MNFKSKILKLSILFMLVLVLLPVASAMDSEDAFYQEYDCGDDEGFVEEYNDIEVEYTQAEDVSSEVEIEVHEESNNNQEYDYYDGFDQNQVEEDAIEVPELNIDSVDVTPNVSDQFIWQDNEEISHDIYDAIVVDIQETSNEELTYNDEIGVNQGSIFISKYDATITVDELIHQIVLTGMEACKTSKLNSDLIELKNNLLIRQDLKTICSDDIIVDDLYNIIITVNNTSGDFAYSIDNSIIGDDHLIFSAGSLSCFFKFYPCFDAAFSCDFLMCEYYFCGDFMMVAAEFFGDFVVDFNLGLQRSICK